MNEAKPRAMFIGTCRMHAPVAAMRDFSEVHVHAIAHRFHTPSQTLKFVRHMAGARQYVPTAMHLFSDLAAKKIFEEGVEREAVLQELEPFAEMWPHFDVFVIEICSLREHMIPHPRKPQVVNTFARRDQIRHADALAVQAAAGLSVPAVPIEVVRQPRAEALRQMRRIKAALGGRPIIWVSHQRPPSDAPEYAVVNEMRKAVAEILRSGARTLGDRFFDPSVVAAEMGQEAFFQENGTDLNHMTAAAAARLGVVYRDMIGRTAEHVRRSAVAI